MAKAKIAGQKTYVLELKNGNTRKLTCPEAWKVTFGNLLPYEGKNGRPGEYRVAFRLYEGNKENLRAVMTDVVAFRDESMSILEKRTSVKRQTVEKKTSQGKRDVTLEARVTEWVNPDREEDTDVPNEFLQLPKPNDEEVTF